MGVRAARKLSVHLAREELGARPSVVALFVGGIGTNVGTQACRYWGRARRSADGGRRRKRVDTAAEILRHLHRYCDGDACLLSRHRADINHMS